MSLILSWAPRRTECSDQKNIDRDSPGVVMSTPKNVDNPNHFMKCHGCGRRAPWDYMQILPLNKSQADCGQARELMIIGEIGHYQIEKKL